MMKSTFEKAIWLFERMQFAYQPIGLVMTDKKPDGASSFKKSGNGCIAKLIFSASKGKAVAIDKDSTGYPCSAFYLGYGDWIFDGIEYFLSNSPTPIGRECERFVKSPGLAKEFVESFVPETHSEKTYVYKPIAAFDRAENPEVVIFFANADQMSALVYLIHYSHPLDFDRVETGFASACMAMSTIPLRYAKEREDKAFWGMHDIAVRSSMPRELTTMSMPFSMFEEICTIADESFLRTEKWEKILERITG